MGMARPSVGDASVEYSVGVNDTRSVGDSEDGEQKMKQLTQQITASVEATTGSLNDYGQRSAIGMARSYLDSQRFKESNLLVTIMEGHDESDCIAVLQEARAWVNAPLVLFRERHERSDTEPRSTPFSLPQIYPKDSTKTQ